MNATFRLSPNQSVLMHLTLKRQVHKYRNDRSFGPIRENSEQCINASMPGRAGGAAPTLRKLVELDDDLRDWAEELLRHLQEEGFFYI